MAAFERTQRRFPSAGVQLTKAASNVDPNKYSFISNARSTLQGTLQARAGLVAVAGASFGSPIHTINRFDDSSPFAGSPNLYLIGAGTHLYMGTVGSGSFPSIESGFSGNPLSLTVLTPPQSPRPYVYVADPNRMEKVDSSANIYRQGILPPTVEPQADVQQLGVNIIDQFSVALGSFWTSVGSPTIVTPVGGVVRVNTTISNILYDNGAAPGYASIVPASMAGINAGMLVQLGTGIGPYETIAVTDTTIAVAPTTVAAILYDSGSTGWCTIQPVGSLGTGQLEAPTLDAYTRRFLPPDAQRAAPRDQPLTGGAGLPTPTSQRIRQVDFPVNCHITIGGEHVIIRSVAVGKDGIQSFRCKTTGTHGAGEAIVGIAAFRAWTNLAWTAGTVISDTGLTNVITPIVPPDPIPEATTSIQATAGIRSYAGWPGVNLAMINGRATLPDDDLHLSIRASLCPNVNVVRVYLSTEPTAGTTPSASDFTANYFFFEWRQSDIIAAIQAQNADSVATIIDARATAQQNATISQPIRRAPMGSVAANPPPTGGGTGGQSGAGITSDALSSQLALGNNQWLELHCKIGDLIQVGTDTSKTLANITAAEILVNVRQAIDPHGFPVAAHVTMSYDSLWVSGGYGPDIGGLGTPYVYAYRYRSSLTGGKSNPSQPLRGGVFPHRQHVLVQGTQSSDPQVDLVDFFKQGATLAEWTYAGTVPNDNPPVFDDVFPDTGLSGGDLLEFDNFPPFPTQDLPRRGTCNVIGSAIQWVSGDQFDTDWAPGSLIVVNDQAYTLYSQPPSSTKLYINENAGNATGVEFTLPGPTLIDQSFGSEWGGPIAGAVFMFGCQNPIDAGMVSWTKGNDPEAASDKNTLQVTTPAEPLQGGFMWDGVSFVSSSERLFVLEPTQDPVTPFRPLETPCGKGFWTPWAFCVSPHGVYFVEKAGISITTGGSPAVSITDADLYPLFPHEGIPGQTVNGYAPVDMTQTSALRLAWIDGWVKFDYLDTNGVRQTLSYREADQSWWPDFLRPGANVHESSTGNAVHQDLIGGVDGQLYTQGGFTDNGLTITASATLIDNQGDARRFKLYRDVFLKANLGGGAGTVALSFTDATVPIATALLNTGAGLTDYVIDTVPQTGIYGTNITATIAWVPVSEINPIWEVFDVAFQMQPELASSWLSGPTTHGYRGYMQVQRALIAYLSTGPVTLSVIIDGTLYTYALPTTGGQYAKNEVVLQAVKGKTYQWGMQGNPGTFLLYDVDSEVWLTPWGEPGPVMVKPFAGAGA